MDDKFLESVRNQAQRLTIDVSNSNLFVHTGNRGHFRERIIEEFLRPLLPNCYGLGTGEIFSRTGNSSNQVDIVIYDDVFSTVFFRQKDIKLFPAESVYGTIEVKSRLTSHELESSVKNIISVKELQRDDSTTLDILPFVEISLGSGLTSDKSIRNPYLGYVFAYDGITSITTAQYLNHQLKSIHDKQLMPDFIFNLEKRYVTLRMMKKEGQLIPSQQGKEYDTFVSVSFDKKEVMTMLFLTLNIQINQTRLKAINMNDYWKTIFRQGVPGGD